MRNDDGCSTWRLRSNRVPRSGARCLRRAAPWLVVVLSACGTPRYLVLEMMPTALAGLDEADDGVRVDLRLGDTWLELNVRNRGHAPALISVDDVTFTTPAGVEHRMIEWVQLQRVSVELGFTAMGNQGFAVPRVIFTQPSGVHFAPADVGRAVRAESLVLQASDSVQLVLFPIEHVRVDPAGLTSVMPLFCDGSAAGSPQHAPFHVHVPVRANGTWKRMVLTGRVVR